MQLDEVRGILLELEGAGCRTWTAGGWGVDALVGHQTRPHRDLDLAVDAADAPTALLVLERRGYRVETDWRPVRVELVRVDVGWVDLHPVVLDDDGHGRQTGLDGTHFDYPRTAFDTGTLDGTRVPCLSRVQQLAFHTGYEPRPVDLHDLQLLDALTADRPTRPLRVEAEQPLAGGNASGAVVRVGNTVRKPWTAATPSVISFVEALRAQGIDAPAPLGRDDTGRQVQELVPGRLAMDADPLSLPELHRVGSLVRAIHDASAGFVPRADAVWETAVPAPGADLVCHNDLAPWNLMLGDRWVFIDWDAAAPSTRLWDLAYAAQTFTLSDTGRDPEEAARGLAAFVDGYGADRGARESLPAAISRRTEAMYALLHASHLAGAEPWGSMFLEGHGDHWAAASRYVSTHQPLWAAALGTSRP